MVHCILVLMWNCLSDTVASVTPNKVRDIRMFLNDSAMDVMYYTSPLYRSEVTLLTVYFLCICISFIFLAVFYQ